ncbi:hypothetical protein HG536_0D01310 [Torulaspora globosa]|uniref:BTB domain-containing protein n=1 Tax=Torulaspora globosa TaxID=48254 RepID=A0A7G3ZGH3_9SACH|nr:uncharacterized protein HG536_0D01310 [Torulaspora globosa]QLL32609.1 hypothetical protein HG536_0D01310 [Torulaspora globosa]
MPQTTSNKRRKDDPTKRDHFGRDISYLRSSLPDLEKLDSIDLYSHDLESGYSPLHVTLRRGYLRKSFLLYKRWKDETEFISHKFGGHIFNQLDREGLNPLELYATHFYKRGRSFPLYIRYQRDLRAEIEWCQNPGVVSQDVRFSFMELPKDEEEQAFIRNRGGSYLLTLGSNVNYQLGTGTKDDRQNMYQLAIDQLNKTSRLQLTSSRFSRILISRYHSIVVTTENKVYTCGNSSRGRLGNGAADIPQASFTEILDLGELEIIMVDTSNHHSLLLTADCHVYSWGWNGYGQLGYSTASKAVDLEKNFGPIPRRIPFLEGEEVVSIACSKIHSCAATRDGKLFMWGLNIGQLGGSKPVHKVADTTHEGQDAYITTVPIIVNCSKLPIDQVVCTEFATFVRFQTNTLMVYTNYTTRLFKIPSPRAKTLKNVDAFDHFTPREIPSTVVEMKCSNIYGNNICFKYSCGRIGIVTVKDESVKLWTKFSNTLPVTLYWAPNFENRKCMDFSVSSKGHLIVCTVNGEVFTNKGFGSTPEKMYSGKLISGRAISVACDPSFASFGIIKDETMNVPMLCPKNRLLYDFAKCSPKNRVSGDRSDFDDFDLPVNGCMTNHQFCIETGENDGSKKLIKEGYSLASFYQKGTASLDQADENGSKFDVKFLDSATRKLICKCHISIIGMRCPKLLRRLPIGPGDFEYDSLKFSWDYDRNLYDGSWLLLVDRSDSGSDNIDYAEILKEVVHFFYTDVRPTNQRALKFLLNFLESYHLANLAYALEGALEHNPEYVAKTPVSPKNKSGRPFIEDSWSHIWESKREDSTKPDTELILRDGITYCHSVVLILRSSTLKTFLERNWHSSDEFVPVPVNLKNFEHATVENVNCILRYLYGLPYDRIYEPIRKEHYSEKVQFFLDMLCLCDALNLEQLKNYTESLAASFINGGTVVPMLINAVLSNSRLLAQNCCWFICLHIGILFSKDNLDLVEEHFDSEIWELLENTLMKIRSEQAAHGQLAWYEQDIDWIGLFSTNLNAFNERFVDPQRTFQPVIDLTSEVKPSNRRKSSTQGFEKSRKSSFIQKSKIAALEEPKAAWTTSHRMSDSSTAVDDNDEFIEVVKKSKRRTSSQTQPPTDLATQDSSPPGKVVIHSANESDSEKLPSLMASRKSPAVPVEGDSSVAKIRKSFKKGSQKQRLQQLSTAAQKPRDGERKLTWGNGSAAKASAATTGHAPARRKKSLPSLYDSDLATTLGKTKKEKAKETWSLGPSASSEVRSHGTWANVQPYVPSPSKQEAAATTRKPTLEERLAAQQFEKWFELESSKIQKQLRTDNQRSKDSLKALYKADDSLPDFITNQTPTKKTNRKLKLKFQSKHKSTETDQITLYPE